MHGFYLFRFLPVVPNGDTVMNLFKNHFTLLCELVVNIGKVQSIFLKNQWHHVTRELQEVSALWNILVSSFYSHPLWFCITCVFIVCFTRLPSLTHRSWGLKLGLSTLTVVGAHNQNGIFNFNQEASISCLSPQGFIPSACSSQRHLFFEQVANKTGHLAYIMTIFLSSHRLALEKMKKILVLKFYSDIHHRE